MPHVTPQSLEHEENTLIGISLDEALEFNSRQRLPLMGWGFHPTEPLMGVDQAAWLLLHTTGVLHCG